MIRKDQIATISTNNMEAPRTFVASLLAVMAQWDRVG